MPPPTQAVEERKRKAERLANDPQLRKVQKQFHIKDEAPEGGRELANLASRDDDGQANQRGEADQDDDADSEESDDADDDSDEAADGHDGGDDESSSSSDTDAESSSSSEDEDGNAGEPETRDQRDPALLAQEQPAADIGSPKDTSISQADGSGKRMNALYDLLTILESSDPVAKAAVNSIAIEEFQKVFPAAAIELAKQRLVHREKLKERQVSPEKADEVMNMILEAQTSMIVAWLKDLGDGSVLFQRAINAAASGQKRKGDREPKPGEEHQTQRTSAEPVMKSQAAREANASVSDQTAAEPSRPDQLIPSSTRPIPSSSSAASATRRKDSSQLGRNTTASEKPPAQRCQDDSELYLRSAYHLFQHHIEEASHLSPFVESPTNARKLISALWRDLSSDVRESWKTLHARVSQDDKLGTGRELAKDLVDKQALLATLKKMKSDASAKVQHTKSPHRKGSAEVLDGLSQPPSNNGLNGITGSGRRSADCYRPGR